MKTSALFDRDTILHLRLPFSFFLLPVFLFALSQSATINIFNSLILFFSLHFLIYPGSNIYNSYMDKDKGSIGMLKNPPPVTKKLYYASIIFDLAGLLICLLVDIRLALLMIIYTGISKAYSWHKIRLKKYAFAGWLVVILFQGGYTYLLTGMTAEHNFSFSWFTAQHITAMALVSLMIGAYYPLTQIYQHDEDSERGDHTMSKLLGIKGTFLFAIVLFVLATAIAVYYFLTYRSAMQLYIFTGSLLPVIIYFFYWMRKVWMNENNANFDYAMKMTFVSSLFLNAGYFILLITR